MSNTTQAPQDSVLRRHWEAANNMQNSQADSATPAHTDNNSSSEGGFFSWLKSFFS